MNTIYNRPRLLLVLTSVFWAGNVIVGRAVAGQIPPVTLACLRWVLASSIFLPFAIAHLRKDWDALRRNWAILLFLGLIGPACFNTLAYMGLVSTEALNGLVLNAAGPMFIAVTAWALFNDRITAGQAAALGIGFFGVLIIVVKGDPATLSGFHFNPGDLLLVAAIVCWAVYTACLRKRPAISWQSFNLVTYAIAAFANLPFAIVENAGSQHMSASWASIAAVLYVAIFPSLLAYIFYNRGVELLGAARAGIYLFLIPVFGAVLAMVYLNEKLHAYHAAGFALIVAGILWANRKPERGKPDASVPLAPHREHDAGKDVHGSALRLQRSKSYVEEGLEAALETQAARNDRKDAHFR